MITKRIQSFTYGLFLPFEALKLILSRPSLLAWSILPLSLTLVLYYYVVGGLIDWAQGSLWGLLEGWGIDPQTWWAWIFLILTKIILLLVGALTFAFTSSIVASPFNDFLAERTERFATPALPPVKDASLRQQIRIIFIDLGKAIAAGIASLAALLLSWVPFLNLIAFVLMFLLITFQYTSYPQTRRGVKLGEGAGFLFRHLFACCGFGFSTSLLFAIPFVGSFALPLAVVGGTLLVARAPTGLK